MGRYRIKKQEIENSEKIEEWKKMIEGIDKRVAAKEKQLEKRIEKYDAIPGFKI